MFDKVLQFPAPAPRSEFDALNEARITEEEAAAARAALEYHYSQQRAREDAAREQPRELTPEQFAARIEYDRYAVNSNDVGSDIVVVVGFAVVTALERY